jgi:hypothetical protein
MDWSGRIFIYCERGQDPSLWAEPFNAITNAAFFLAGLAALSELRRRRDAETRLAEWGLIGLIFVIGTGSFLFHTFATRWAQVADWGPISVFMVGYLAYALRRFIGLGWGLAAPLLLAFLWTLHGAGAIECRPALLPVTAEAGARCLNGSLAYGPALVALAMVAAAAAFRRHPSGRLLAFASAVFLVSLTLRTLDIELCGITRVAGRATGMHFLWHVLNALTLYILLVAALRYGRTQRAGQTRAGTGTDCVGLGRGA